VICDQDCSHQEMDCVIVCKNTFLCVLDENDFHVRSKATSRSKSVGASPNSAVLGQGPDHISTPVGDHELMQLWAKLSKACQLGATGDIPRHPLCACASERAASDCQSGSATNHSMEARTTVMIRNIPYKYSVDELAAEIEESGFQGMFDLVYLPMLANRLSNCGYAFANFTSPAAASEFRSIFSKHRFNQHHDKFSKHTSVSYAKNQGFSAYNHMFWKKEAPARNGLLIKRSQPDM